MKTFAEFLGYEKTLVEMDKSVFPVIYTEITNPESEEEFIDKKRQEYMEEFKKPYLTYLESEIYEKKISGKLYEAKCEAQMTFSKVTLEYRFDEKIIKPVEDALVSEIVVI
jgi:hypothetical protein